MRRGDLVEVRWGNHASFQDMCVVLEVRQGVLGGSCVVSNVKSKTYWVSRQDSRDEILVTNPANGDMSWIDEHNARLIAEG